MPHPILRAAAAAILMCAAAVPAAAQPNAGIPGPRFNGAVVSPALDSIASTNLRGRGPNVRVPTRRISTTGLPGTQWASIQGTTTTVPGRASVTGWGAMFANVSSNVIYILMAHDASPVGASVSLSITSPADGSYFLVQCEVMPGAYNVGLFKSGGPPPSQTFVAGEDWKLTFLLDAAAAGNHLFTIYRANGSAWHFRGCEVRKLT